MQDHEHPNRTWRSQYRYLFTAKHHGGGTSEDAQWLPSLSEQDECAVFDVADAQRLLDDSGNLYGALPDGEESLRYLGTWQQQIAEFPLAAEGSPWHGYSLWPLNEFAPPNRRSPKHRPATEVFNRMVQTGLITLRMRKRLLKGDHV